MKLKKKYIAFMGGIGLIILIAGFIFFRQPSIVFHQNSENIEIHTNYQPIDFIKEVKNEDIKNVIINDKVNKDQLGEYEIIYTLKDKDYHLSVHVVDTILPTYDIHDVEVFIGNKVTPELFIKNIKDQTQTKAYFKEEYLFDKEGKQDVVVIVEDEAGNKTEKNASITIKEDKEKPTISGLKNLTVKKGESINYLEGLVAKDNYDKNPKITVDSSKVNLNQVGQYPIVYTVEDKNGNKNTYTKTVSVTEKRPIQTIYSTNEKIVYLTFDDGPSKNTERILDILKKYNAKATFFVTGNGKKYNYLIKRAHDEGHTIGLHTYSHDYAKVYSSVDGYFDDLTKIGNMVKEQIGFVPQYIRFPGGASNTISRKYTKGIMSTLVLEVQNRGYQFYDWNVSSGDAARNVVDTKKIVKNSTSSKYNNIMLLAHDTQMKTTTAEALPQIIEHYQSLGYTFKGIDKQTFTPHQRVQN